MLTTDYPPIFYLLLLFVLHDVRMFFSPFFCRMVSHEIPPCRFPVAHVFLKSLLVAFLSHTFFWCRTRFLLVAFLSHTFFWNSSLSLSCRKRFFSLSDKDNESTNQIHYSLKNLLSPSLRSAMSRQYRMKVIIALIPCINYLIVRYECGPRIMDKTHHNIKIEIDDRRIHPSSDINHKPFPPSSLLVAL